MKTQSVRSVWDSGRAVLDCWVSGTSMLNAETIGRAGFDSVLIDMQHSMCDFKDVANTIMALSSSPVAVIVRVPGNDQYIIQRVLDAGADGVMCPMINTPEEAARFVGAVRYPPTGYRSFGAYRTTGDTQDYYRRANSELLAFAQIETVQAMENVDNIAATPGLDALFVWEKA